MLMVRCLSGEEIELTDRAIAACRELERAGLLDTGSTRPTRAALSRRREFPPPDGPLSKAAMAQFHRYLAGDRDVTDDNRAAYRELAAAGLMAAGHTFRDGDESIYQLTKEGFERKAEILACAQASAPTAPSPGRAAGPRR
jgi:hypothetical protein